MRNHVKKSFRQKYTKFDVFNVIFMLVLCLVTLYPYINQMAMSLNEGSDAVFGGITFYPRKFTLDNYRVVFKNSSIKSAFVVTVASVIFGTVLSLIVTASAGYALSRPKLPYRRQLTFFLIIPTFIGAGLIPGFMLYRELHLINNFLIYVIPGCFSFYNMVIIRSFIQGIPESLVESAELDGANDVQTLFKIILPLCKPVLATVCLWVAVGHWNNYTTSLYYITKPKLYTIQFILMKLIKESEVLQSISKEAAMDPTLATVTPTAETVKAATIIVTTLPIVCLYPFLQKYFIQGVTVGAVKE